ncbi:S-layer homology domain-containing protein [Acutalibacter muris]|uniref:S-layer homology domain-containing protein n=1 Tax=Acutalibacter muris TaxID=1796620 RepID=UPI001C3E91A3|nr:S-layer homology domain-containing protein [Acutalibacter muris]
MSKLFRRFLAAGTAAVMLTTTSIPAQAAAERFMDVKPGAWYYTAVDYAVSEGLFSGTSANTFSPGSPMTRGMFVRVLGNKAKVDPDEYPSSTFSDVQAGVWFAPCVEWAAQNGIVTGTGSGRFSPNQSVTREQMAVILYNYAEFAGCDMTTRAGLLDQFPDGGRVSGYAKYAMEWAVTHNILSGSGGRLDPKGTATRAQVAQIFYNSRELLANGSKDPQPPTPSPSPDPSPSPEPGTPKIPITDEVRAKLKPNQDPEKILEYVLHGKNDDPTFSYDGTSAQWDPALRYSEDCAIISAGSWENEESDSRSSSAIGNLIQQALTRTASDRFYITAEEEDGYFALYYHPADKPDSQQMREIKTALTLTRPVKYDRSLCYEGAGWAGPMSWDQYHGARGIAEKIEYYLLELHPYTTRYYLTEPEPGVFYLLY